MSNPEEVTPELSTEKSKEVFKKKDAKTKKPKAKKPKVTELLQNKDGSTAAFLPDGMFDGSTGTKEDRSEGDAPGPDMSVVKVKFHTFAKVNGREFHASDVPVAIERHLADSLHRCCDIVEDATPAPKKKGKK